MTPVFGTFHGCTGDRPVRVEWDYPYRYDGDFLQEFIMPIVESHLAEDFDPVPAYYIIDQRDGRAVAGYVPDA